MSLHLSDQISYDTINHTLAFFPVPNSVYTANRTSSRDSDMVIFCTLYVYLLEALNVMVVKICVNKSETYTVSCTITISFSIHEKRTLNLAIYE